MSNLSRSPLIALSSETKNVISTLLNPPRWCPTDSGLLRDWRGFAHLCQIENVVMPAIASDPDPSSRILNIVQQRSQDFTLESLKNALEKLGRWDIIEYAEPYLVKDAQLYLERLEKSQTAAKVNNFVVDSEILTFDDQFRIERGEERQHYDAFLLYADEDEDFANEMVETLERKNHFKLCLKDRDLIAGIPFEHKAIMRLISERCNRLIVILTPEFLKSPANEFFINFAQASAIDQNYERKIIPCVYRDCELPQLKFLSKIYFKKLTSEYFWNKLILSMRANSTDLNVQRAIEVPKKNIENKNGFVTQNDIPDKKPAKEENKEELGETSKPKESTKIRISLPWMKKQKTEVKKVPCPSEEISTEESIPSLPSLDGLDSLSSLTPNTNTVKQKSKKKRKFMGTYMKKVQALLEKSS